MQSHCFFVFTYRVLKNHPVVYAFTLDILVPHKEDILRMLTRERRWNLEKDCEEEGQGP